jgi:hypothetical protein
LPRGIGQNRTRGSCKQHCNLCRIGTPDFVVYVHGSSQPNTYANNSRCKKVNYTCACHSCTRNISAMAAEGACLCLIHLPLRLLHTPGKHYFLHYLQYLAGAYLALKRLVALVKEGNYLATTLIKPHKAPKMKQAPRTDLPEVTQDAPGRHPTCKAQRHNKSIPKFHANLSTPLVRHKTRQVKMLTQCRALARNTNAIPFHTGSVRTVGIYLLWPFMLGVPICVHRLKGEPGTTGGAASRNRGSSIIESQQSNHC